jgi:hypothetical protein
MADLVRCSNCRGMKKVAKLGGMMGDCNLCKGTGEIEVSAKPVAVVESMPLLNDIIAATANCIGIVDSASASDAKIEVKDVVKDVIKIDGKKAIFKRKKTA